MVSGKFQGSSTADFSSGVVNLLTISTAPAEGVLTTKSISNPTAFRYVRYLGPSGGFCNAAEVEFYTAVVPPEPPTAPSGLSATGADSQIALSWDPVSNAPSYRIKASRVGGGPYSVLGNPSNTKYLNSGLTNGTVYYYVVSAIGEGGEGPDSAETNAVPSVAISPDEYGIAGHTIASGTNLSLTVANSVPGHLYWILASDRLTPTDWQSVGEAVAGNSSNVLFNIPITGIQPNRYFKLDVQRQ